MNLIETSSPMTSLGTTFLPTADNLARHLAGSGRALTEADVESLIGLHVLAADAGHPSAVDLAAEAVRVAGRIGQCATGQWSEVVAEAIEGLSPAFDALVRVPASVGAQGVEAGDAVRLAQRWAQRHRADYQNVCVVGIRTGGAYLAPYVCSYLDSVGLSTHFVSLRPGQAPPRPDRGTAVLILDDPPLTGRAVAEAVAAVGRRDVFVLIPVFNVVSALARLGDLGVTVVALPRHEWASALRLTPAKVTELFADNISWLVTNQPVMASSFVAGYGNSAIQPWPVGRPRAAPRAAFRTVTASGEVRDVVVRWLPPGVFGGPARLAAQASGSPPATLGIGTSCLVTEFVATSAAGDHRITLTDKLGYVASRARSLPVHGPAFPRRPDRTLRAVAVALGRLGIPANAQAMANLLHRLPPSLPDNRCQADKWIVHNRDVVKFGSTDHPLRRDNQLLSALIDLAALACHEPAAELALLLADLPSGPLTEAEFSAALEVAILYYAHSRGQQLPRMYNTDQAESLALEAIRAQTRVDDLLRARGARPTTNGRNHVEIGIRIDRPPPESIAIRELEPLSRRDVADLGDAILGGFRDPTGRCYVYPNDDYPRFVAELNRLRVHYRIEWLGIPTLTVRECP